MDKLKIRRLQYDLATALHRKSLGDRGQDAKIEALKIELKSLGVKT